MIVYGNFQGAEGSGLDKCSIWLTILWELRRLYKDGCEQWIWKYVGGGGLSPFQNLSEDVKENYKTSECLVLGQE
jgi:hypothetical protein